MSNGNDISLYKNNSNIPKLITIPKLHQMKKEGIPIVSLTAYDYSMGKEVNLINYFKNIVGIITLFLHIIKNFLKLKKLKLIKIFSFMYIRNVITKNSTFLTRDPIRGIFLSPKPIRFFPILKN